MILVQFTPTKLKLKVLKVRLWSAKQKNINTHEILQQSNKFAFYIMTL